MTWAEIEAALRALEDQHRNLYITRVFTDDDAAPELYYGRNSNGIVERGEPGYRLSTGEYVSL